MSKQQQAELDAMLRKERLDTAGDVSTLRASFEGLMRQAPVAPDVRQTPIAVGGIGAVEVTIDGTDSADVILYFHGGVYAIGSAEASVPLVADLARRVQGRASPDHGFPRSLSQVTARPARTWALRPSTLACGCVLIGAP
ncbi:MAG TPA: hypothetical protein VIX82_13520 [Solirubrobacteraceae bacterium]